MIEMKVLIPIAISIVALLISIISLYMSGFRPGKPHLTAGEHIAISHQLDGVVNFILAVNFANAGSKHLTIDRVALLIQHRGSPEGYLLEPNSYLSLTGSGSFIFDSLAVPITIFGGENVTKQVMFTSSTGRPTEFETEFQMTRADTYDLSLLSWMHGSAKPLISDSFSLVVTEAHVATLANHIKEKKLDSVKLPQSKWRSWDAHYCKEHDVDAIKCAAKVD